MSDNGALLALGLMSGTSMDGIDAAIISTDGERIDGYGESAFTPYSAGERSLLRQAVEAARELTARDNRSGVLADAEAMVTQKHAEAVARLLKMHDGPGVTLIGFHGQTVLHKPEARLTVQLGDGQALAKVTGLPVVYDFRAADIAAGGQGAPFVPAYHRALADAAALPRPVAFVNIGGVSNVTWIGDDGTLIAFDSGPGNALLDDWALKHTGEPMDRDGKLAASGHPDMAALETLLRHPYLSAPPPKSLDRNSFSIDGIAALSPADGAATLTAFSAAAISHASKHFPAPVRQWVLCGGGARNPVMTEVLKRVLLEPVTRADDLALNSDMIEAQAFAFLAVRSMRGLPLSYPGTTGVAEPCRGGVHAGVEPSPSISGASSD